MMDDQDDLEEEPIEVDEEHEEIADIKDSNGKSIDFDGIWKTEWKEIAASVKGDGLDQNLKPEVSPVNKPCSPWVTVYCPDVELLERSKKAGLNRSRLFTEALRVAIDQGERSLITLLELEETRSQTIRVKQRIAALKEEIIANEEYLVKISEHLDELEKQEAIIQRASMVSELFIALNKICVENKFNVEAVERAAGEVLRIAKREVPEFELRAHVKRLKELLPMHPTI